MLYRIALMTVIAIGTSTLSVADDSPMPLLKSAYDSYITGEKADTISSRKQDFNKALEDYTKLEKTYNPSFGNGKLYYNIANSYFQLEEYPWAALYYYKAQKLMPREERVQRNLNITLQKLSVTPTDNTSIYQPLINLQSLISLPERLQLFFNFGIILLALVAANIMRPNVVIKRLIILFGIVWSLLFLSVMYARFMAPVEGVLVKSTSLYRDAGEQYAKVSDQPVLSGNKVQVLEVLQNGEWLKVLSPTGELGYVPVSAIRII